MDEFAGIPAHPLFVHVPLVLLPLLAIGVVAMVANPDRRRRFAWVLLGSTLLTAVVTLLATQSGEPFREGGGAYHLVGGRRRGMIGD